MSKIRIIEKDPPVATGNVERDIKAQEDYLVYLREQLNFILTNIQRRENSGV